MKALTFSQIRRFLTISHKIWPEIIAGHTPSESSQLPAVLPQNACDLLAAILDLDLNSTQLCWIAFGDFVQDIGPEEVADDIFRIHGLDHQIGMQFNHLESSSDMYRCIATL